MKVGHVIRSERIRQDMKQIVLAKGICTPSYLSKIERNLIHPSDDVAELLLERLGIDATKFHEPDHINSDKEFMELILASYRMVITKKDKTYTKQQLDMLMAINPLSYDDSVYYTYLLVTFRFRLILGGDLEERKIELDAVDGLTSYFDEFQMYLFNINRGLFYYVSGILVKSIHYFEAAFETMNNLSLDDWEVAELHYMIGITYVADNRTLHSREHVQKALSYFSSQFLMGRVMDCYIIMGVVHKQSRNFDESLNAYLKARQICEEFGLNSNLELILHNIGALYGVIGDREKAIKSFKESYEYNSHLTNGQLLSILCIAMEYSKLKNKKLILEWCEKGIKHYELLENEGQASYYHQLSFMKSMYSENGLCEDIAKTSLVYFKENLHYELVSKYSIALANWYFENKKYKLSATLYEEAHKYGNIYRNITEWEDL
ncbi:tetratricopeptide repeat protein [Sporosarcina oncorhynchi]|uniref:Tetratricopeptide repeat protein n=1 Tax=Sporosarcina oncorhynchi TaxID=3056444 RepID=A0ABZ0LBK3_9BACL|nr:helix-turn-helix domain-containing protein [Sporosarcina sp. T2O-4]WOV89127.1 tetratricopeptide repeat protein [Sporosarcina sp. T2O-4]